MAPRAEFAGALPAADRHRSGGARRNPEEQELALNTLVRGKLGNDPEDLGGSAWEAVGASFVLFTLGQSFPFFVLSGVAAVGTILVLSALALFGIGGGITLLTGRILLCSGIGQVGIGLTAAILAYGVGTLLGMTITG